MITKTTTMLILSHKQGKFQNKYMCHSFEAWMVLLWCVFMENGGYNTDHYKKELSFVLWDFRWRCSPKETWEEIKKPFGYEWAESKVRRNET